MGRPMWTWPQGQCKLDSWMGSLVAAVSLLAIQAQSLSHLGFPLAGPAGRLRWLGGWCALQGKMSPRRQLGGV